jgi:hypothetical protein
MQKIPDSLSSSLLFFFAILNFPSANLPFAINTHSQSWSSFHINSRLSRQSSSNVITRRDLQFNMRGSQYNRRVKTLASSIWPSWSEISGSCFECLCTGPSRSW